jgi:NAD(P)-dependent dehydrogenase (short-subunit alcohol dehydrogenase family)
MLAARHGCDVAITYKDNRAAADATVAALVDRKARAVAIQADVAREDDIERMFEEAARALGPITQFVHSAGIVGRNSTLAEASAGTVRDVLDVNLFGALIGARAAVRRMSTARGGSGGSIVLVSSVAAVTGAAGEYVFYAAAKGGVEALVTGLAREVAREGIRVNALRAGTTVTDIHEPGRLERVTPSLPMGRPASPEEIAEGIVFLLSPASSYVSGSVLTVAGAR